MVLLSSAVGVSLLSCSGPVDASRSAAAGLVQEGQIPPPDNDDRQTLGPFYELSGGPDWETQSTCGACTTERGGGLVVADLDGDDNLDILLPNASDSQLFLGDGDLHWVDATDRLPTIDVELWGGSAADVDGDGDQDLFLASRRGPNLFLENDGEGYFADVTDRAGVAGDEASIGGSWGDLDGDGALDLFVANHADRDAEHRGAPTMDRLYLGSGSGEFEDHSALLGDQSAQAATFNAGWLDLDLDGRTDLYLVHDWGSRLPANQLLLNTSLPGVPSLYTAADTGLELASCTMGLGIGDVNGDRVPDLAISDTAHLHLLLSAGPLRWYDAGESLGLVPSDPRIASWAPELVDLDNDGDLDLMVTFGSVEDDTRPLSPQPDGLWVQQEDGSFEEQSGQWGVDGKSIGRGMVVADLNGDGWLDLVRRDYKGDPTRIDMARPGLASWLEVRLEGAPPNTAALGATIEVSTAEGDQLRWIGSGSTGLGSSGPAVAHFGLGGSEIVEYLTVTWPDGATSQFADIPARQRVRVVREEAALSR